MGEAAARAHQAALDAKIAADLAARTAVEAKASAAEASHAAATAAGAAAEEAEKVASEVQRIADEAQVAAAFRPEDQDENEDPESAKAAAEEAKQLTANEADAAREAAVHAQADVKAAEAAAAEALAGIDAAEGKASLWAGARQLTQAESDGCAIVWLHGLGETEASWCEIIQASVHPPVEAGPCRWIWPRAEFGQCIARGGALTLQWFDVFELPVCQVVRSVPDRQRRNEDPSQVAEAMRKVHASIAALEADSVSSECIVVGGFGQGAALAAHAVLRYERPLAGAVMFSGWVPCLDALTEAATPSGRCAKLLWCHGARDRVIEPQLAGKQARALQALGADVDFRLLPELPFGVNQEELAIFDAWLAKQ